MSECWGDVYMVGLGLGGQTRRTTSEEGGKSTEGWGPNRPQDRRRWAGGEAVGGHLDGSWTLGLWRWGNSNLVFRILLTMGMRLYKKSANVMSRFWNILLGHLSHYKCLPSILYKFSQPVIHPPMYLSTWASPQRSLDHSSIHVFSHPSTLPSTHQYSLSAYSVSGRVLDTANMIQIRPKWTSQTVGSKRSHTGAPVPRGEAWDMMELTTFPSHRVALLPTVYRSGLTGECSTA